MEFRPSYCWAYSSSVTRSYSHCSKITSTSLLSTTEHNSWWESNGFSASQEIFRVVRNTKGCCHTYLGVWHWYLHQELFICTTCCNIQLWIWPTVEGEDFIVLTMNGYRWSSGFTLLILSLGTIWRRAVIFTDWCPLNWRLGGPQSRSGRFEEQKNAFLLP